MTQDDELQLYNLSRRRVLAGLGAVGIASAGAGLGTSAFFSDQEEFTDNTLQAGTLDLKLDYKATYFGGPGRLDAVKAMDYPDAEEILEDGEPTGRYLLAQAPSPEDEQAWEDRVQGEAFDFCSPDADEFLVNGDGIPMFTLSDVKPGDSGEVTVSIHICDNPGYLRMVGDITNSAENGQTEPELEAEGEDTDGLGELADAIEVCVWYDEDCDNVFEPTGTGQQNELEVALVSDTSGSITESELAQLKTAGKDFVDNLSIPDEAAAISFAASASLDQELTTNYQAVKDAIDTYDDSGSTNMSAGISTAETELLTGTNATAGASKVMILLSDGSPNSDSAATAAANSAKSNIRIFTIALGSGADEVFLESIASSSDDAFVAPDGADLDTVYAEIAQIVLDGEQKIAEGTMAEVFAQLSEGVLLDGNRQEEGDQPYPGATTQCIGFEWELPFEVGNEVQSDSVGFDFGFEVEQSRHNETPFTTPEPTPTGTPVGNNTPQQG
ncbi:vWA domain-containing protein [Halorubrum ezzemoulense]|uniref:vWA domain-containing protein n=1 Tax=Halorubrum ezzemoulense TaxID=337243 RepID=UPI00232D5825|nr:vWA domain-containing protein [Halorubrum ezzemoulense]MDB2275777.1 vWA domain-containing protein [Halorubrum ezzemoulense]